MDDFPSKTYYRYIFLDSRYSYYFPAELFLFLLFPILKSQLPEKPTTHDLQDLLREFIKRPNYKWSDLPSKARAFLRGLQGLMTWPETFGTNELRWEKVSFWRQYSNRLQKVWNQPSQILESFTNGQFHREKTFLPLRIWRVAMFVWGASPGIWQVAVQMNDTHPTIAAPCRGAFTGGQGTRKWVWTEVYLPSKGQFFDRENNRQPVDLG